MATPLPLLALHANDSYPFRRHAGFQTLLDSGAVVGYEVYIQRHRKSMATGSLVRVALADDEGVRWVQGVDTILEEESRTPGITLAVFALLADMWCTLCPSSMNAAWWNHDPDSDEHSSYIRVFLTKDGYVVGTDDPEEALDMQIEDALGALDNSDTDEERAEAMMDFDIGQIAAIALVQSLEPSAHERLVLTQKAQDAFNAWEQAYPQWRAKGFDLCAPTA